MLVGLILAVGCSRPAAVPPISLPFPIDSATGRQLDVGVIQRDLWSAKGPWGIHVLDVDLSSGYCAVAVKGATGAVGRKKTSQLLAELSAVREVIGGVNADFFTLAGSQGVPTGTLISEGRVIVGPGRQPALVMDSTGRARAITMLTSVAIRHNRRSDTTAAWNRPLETSMSVYDARWGTVLDTASGITEVIVDRGRVARIDTSVAGSPIPRDGFVIVTGRRAPEDVKKWSRSFALGDSVEISPAITPLHPREAVGGRPILVSDSAITADVETEGQASFRARNPRTAVGIANDGRRLILVVIDGRQKPYSDGMTLGETAELMLALGARDAINLDGGGSSALVYRDRKAKALRVANRPSDPTGERAVGDALGIVKGCR